MLELKEKLKLSEENTLHEFAAVPNSRIALVGNPNVGKSVTFNLLTGQYVIVSNYPGTTVDYSSAKIDFGGGRTCDIIDTPGTNSLIPKSEDEEVTRNVLWNNEIDFAVQVADYKNLRRALLVTLELIEMKIPIILNLNMEDEAEERGITIDTAALKKLLGGVPVVCTTAILKKGLDALKNQMSAFVRGELSFKYDDETEALCRVLGSKMPAGFKFKKAAAVMMISGDDSVFGQFGAAESKEMKKVISGCDEKKLSQMARGIFQTRSEIIESIVKEVYDAPSIDKKPTFRARLGLWLTDYRFGTVALVLTLYGLYMFVGVFGAGRCVDFLQNRIFGRPGPEATGYINPFFANIFGSVFGAKSFIFRMFMGEYGLLTMGMTYAIAIVFPIMFTFFFSFSFLEDSGYLPRLTILSDRIFKFIGLNGKAVLPVVLGLGCGTMAMLTTRILDSKKERLIATIILALGIPCSAQLGVMMGLSSKISWQAAALVFMVVLLQVIIVGKLSARYLEGDSSPFIMELPPMRFPKLWNITKKTYNRVIWFLEEVVPLFLAGTLFLFAIAETGILARLEVLFAPVITGMLGLPREATFAFIMGFLRRDYGAAGLYTLAEKGLLSPVQIMVALVTITLFVPCVASFFMMVKERGAMVAFIILMAVTPYAFLVGFLFRLFLIYCMPGHNFAG